MVCFTACCIFSVPILIRGQPLQWLLYADVPVARRGGQGRIVGCIVKQAVETLAKYNN